MIALLALTMNSICIGMAIYRLNEIGFDIRWFAALLFSMGLAALSLARLIVLLAGGA